MWKIVITSAPVMFADEKHSTDPIINKFQPDACIRPIYNNNNSIESPCSNENSFNLNNLDFKTTKSFDLINNNNFISLIDVLYGNGTSKVKFYFLNADYNCLQLHKRIS